MDMKPNFNDLKDLHRCADHLLRQAPASSRPHLKHISETILKMLDPCGATRDLLLLANDQLQHLHSAARRTILDSSDFGAQLSAHNLHNKNLKKEMCKCLASLNHMKKYNKYFFTSDLSLIDPNLIVVVHVLREVRIATISIARSLLLTISTPVAWISSSDHKHTSPVRRSLATRISQRLFEKPTRVYDAAAGSMEFALEEAGKEKALDELEVELERIMRRLIHTRVLILNILNN